MNAPVKVKKIEKPGWTNHYCQFSGDGDIYIDAAKEEGTLVINKETIETDDPKSPIDGGTSISACEGEKVTLACDN